MARLKLTKPGFENFTGFLLGAEFVDGIADHISAADVDTIAAAIGGDLLANNGEVLGPAGSFYRRTQSPLGVEPDGGAGEDPGDEGGDAGENPDEEPDPENPDEEPDPENP